MFKKFQGYVFEVESSMEVSRAKGRMLWEKEEVSELGLRRDMKRCGRDQDYFFETNFHVWGRNSLERLEEGINSSTRS